MRLRDICFRIGQLSAIFVASWPMLLIFGLFAEDANVFFHKMVIALVCGILSMLFFLFIGFWVD